MKSYMAKWTIDNGGKTTKEGGVISPHTGKELSVWSDEYPRVAIFIPEDVRKGLGISRRSCSVNVHRLIAYDKYGDEVFEEGVQVRHLDGNRANNSWDNIAIGTQSDNMMDRPKEERLRIAKIAAKRQRKFTKSEVRELRKILKFFPSPKVARVYGVSKSTISYIENGKTYRDAL